MARRDPRPRRIRRPGPALPPERPADMPPAGRPCRRARPVSQAARCPPPAGCRPGHAQTSGPAPGGAGVSVRRPAPGRHRPVLAVPYSAVPTPRVPYSAIPYSVGAVLRVVGLLVRALSAAAASAPSSSYTGRPTRGPARVGSAVVRHAGYDSRPRHGSVRPGRTRPGSVPEDVEASTGYEPGRSTIDAEDDPTRDRPRTPAGSS